MTTNFDKPLKRELMIGGTPYILTITQDGLKLVPKGKRKGHELGWEPFISGDAALSTALNASLRNAPAESSSTSASKSPARRARAK